MMGVRGGPESIDPQDAAPGVHAAAARHVIDTRARSDDDLRIEPGLAVARAPIDEAPREFKLRESAAFHDGPDPPAPPLHDAH